MSDLRTAASELVKAWDTKEDGIVVAHCIRNLKAALASTPADARPEQEETTRIVELRRRVESAKAGTWFGEICDRADVEMLLDALSRLTTTQETAPSVVDALRAAVASGIEGGGVPLVDGRHATWTVVETLDDSINFSLRRPTTSEPTAEEIGLEVVSALVANGLYIEGREEWEAIAVESVRSLLAKLSPKET